MRQFSAAIVPSPEESKYVKVSSFVRLKGVIIAMLVPSSLTGSSTPSVREVNSQTVNRHICTSWSLIGTDSASRSDY